MAVDGEGVAAPAGQDAGAAGRHPPLACFVLLAKFLGVPADPEQIAHERGRGDDPYTPEDLTRVAKRLGLVARLRDAGLPAFGKLPLPALTETHGAGRGRAAGRSCSSSSMTRA